MNRKHLFLIALAVLFLTPLYIWVIQPTYERYQIAGKAEAYFNEIPVFPGSTPVEKDLSFYNIGYGYRYKVNDDPEKIINYFKTNIKDWKFDHRSDTADSKSAVFNRSGDTFMLLISVWKIDNKPLTSPLYGLTVSVYKP